MKTLLSIYIIAGLTSFTSLSFATTPTFSSGVSQNSLIELYTSQGCSSCPPADKWLRGFKKDNRLFKDIFPVAFHVNYDGYID